MLTYALRRRVAGLLILVLAALAGNVQAANDVWRLVSDKNGIQVYMKHDDEARIKTFRGVTRFTLDSLHPLSGVLNDTPNMQRWMHFVSGATEIRRTDYSDRVYRFTTDLPWPVSDREAVVDLKIRQDPATQGVTVHVINAPRLLPPNPDYIRFPEMNGVFSFIPTGKPQEIEVTYELILDPGGYIPAFLANFILKDTPYYTLQRLRGVVTRAEYQSWKDPELNLPW